MSSISSKTKVYSVIGHPVSQSFSPKIHNYLFEKYKTYLSKNEINYFSNLLKFYENGKIPFSSVIVAIQIYATRFDDKDLLNQTFFNPYPIELISIADSGKGRNL